MKPDGIRAQQREETGERVEVSVAHYIIVKLMAKVHLKPNTKSKCSLQSHSIILGWNPSVTILIQVNS